MNEQTITVTLPNSVYDRIRTTAQATSLTSEEVIKQSVILLLPALESDIPSNLRLSLTKLSFPYAWSKTSSTSAATTLRDKGR